MTFKPSTIGIDSRVCRCAGETMSFLLSILKAFRIVSSRPRLGFSAVSLLSASNVLPVTKHVEHRV